MNITHPGADRPVTLPDSGAQRLRLTMGRAIRKKCPYCGGGHLFEGWFTLKKRCPHCNTLFEYEEGHMLGSYVVNLGVTELLTVAIVVWMIAGTAMSVLQMQIWAVVFAVGLPLLFYPFALLLWIALDISIHNPGDFSHRVRK